VDWLLGGLNSLSHGDRFDQTAGGDPLVKGGPLARDTGQRATFGFGRRKDIMKKVALLVILCALLAVPMSFAGNDQIGYALELDPTLPDYVNAAWLGYLMERQIYIREHSDQYKLAPGIVIPTFDEEVDARRTLAQIWKELKEKDQGRKDKYLDELVPVHKADFMREYVWTYLRQQSWSGQPKDLRLNEFSRWQQLHLQGHQPETHGNIRITKESAKP
jgi:hypothetical protein